MPNWCNNYVIVGHADTAKLEALAEAVRQGNFLKHVIPVPQALLDTVAGYPGADKEAEHKAQMERNLELYGAKDWYDFCVNRWGTKWDVEAYDPEEVVVEGGSIRFGFDSAWAPPVGIYEAMVEDEGYSVQAYYHEPGMAFCGRWQDGCDDYYEIGNMSSETVREMLPEDLDDMMGISETMAEYEEQEKDEVQTWYEDGVEKHGLTPHKN